MPKIVLPFDLITHLQETPIAGIFDLRNEGYPPRTVIELHESALRDLVVLLKNLHAEVRREPQTLQKQFDPEALRAALNRAEVLREAYQFIEDRIPAFPTPQIEPDGPEL